MFFSEILGQESVKRSLIESVKEERISHTILFQGPMGSGKMNLAIAYSRYVNCLNRSETDACGVCRSCVKYNKYAHPDLHFLFPIVKAKGREFCDDYLDDWREMLIDTPYFDIDIWLSRFEVGNKRAIIYSGEGDKIISKFAMKSYESTYKTLIVWLPERLHSTMANKILKLVEEPPEKTLIIFVSDDLDSVLPTIKSRTQIISTSSIPVTAIATELFAKGVKESEAVEIARISEGDFVKAISLISHSESRERNFIAFQNLMRLAYGRKILDMLNWADEVASFSREDILSFLSFSSRMVRENFILNLKNEELNYISPSFYEWCKKFSPFINEKNILDLFREINSAHVDISRTGNPKIVLTHLGLMVIKFLKV